MSRIQSATCILNASADAARTARDKLAAMFSQAHVEIDIVDVKDSEGIGGLARNAIAENRKLVVAGGGDGTINSVAAALIGTDVILGVLPLGTFNHFAKDLKIPLEIEAAVENIFSGTVVSVDVGEVNGHIFLNNSSLGIYPRVIHEREAIQQGGYGKWVAFAGAAITVFERYSPFRVRTKEDEATTLPLSIPFIFVGNNRYKVAGLHIGERSSLDGGKLWICQAPHVGRLKLLRLALQALIGQSKPLEIVILERAEFWVRPKARTLYVATDGEVTRMDTPLHYRIRPRALRVIVPYGRKAAEEPGKMVRAKG